MQSNALRVLSPKAARVMNDEEYEAFRKMREVSALIPIEEERLPKSGWAKILCGDGDDTPPIIGAYKSLTHRANGEDTCTHPITVEGGPAAGCCASAFHKLTFKGSEVVRFDEFIWGRLEGILKIKTPERVKNVGYMPHCKCGMCRATKTSIWTNFLHTGNFKDNTRMVFKGDFQNHKILPFFNLTGYPEADDPMGPHQLWLLRRIEFEKLASQMNVT